VKRATLMVVAVAGFLGGMVQDKAKHKKFVRIRLLKAFGVLCLLLGATDALRADFVFAVVAEANGNLDRLNITTGTSTSILNNGAVYFGLAYNANESVLYGIVAPTFGDNTSLVTINQTTGVNTPVGANGVALTTVTNLANGQLFGVGFDDNLYQINPNTGVATLVGSTGLPSLLTVSDFNNSLASNGTTLYYTLDTDGGAGTLYTLNTTTGLATPVGALGTTGILGSAFAGPTFGTGQLYGFTGTGATYVINLTTGQASSFNNNGIDDIFGGVGIVTAAAAPEPTSLALLASGIACLAGYGRLRRKLPVAA
jgi:hypothetical protein